MNRIIFTAMFFCLSLMPACSAELVRDNLVDSTLQGKAIKKPPVKNVYNFESVKRIPIELSIISDIGSEQDITEGQTIVFRSLNDVWYNKKCIVKKGDFVKAKVETIITSGMNGIPASIIFDDFQFDNIEEDKLQDSYEKFGQDRSLWVYPLKWALTFLPPTGTLTNFIKGGHAKLKTHEVITVYYYPEW